MPSYSEHKDKADHNREFLTSLSIDNHPDWVAVVAFYTALHLIERLSSCESLHHGSHPPRGKYLARHCKHSVIRHHYQALYDAAHVARYGTQNQFKRSFHSSSIKSELIDINLNAVDKYIDNHFHAMNSSVAGS
jgi:hypothetical protein